MAEKCIKFKQDGKEYNLYDLPDGFVIKGDLDLNDNDLTKLPDLSKIEVKGNFDCGFNELTSLEGAPKKVGGYFSCVFSQLISLEGAPQEVGGYFDCKSNNIASLKGAPQKVGGNFDCSYNQITSLEGAPQEVGGDFDCSNNQLTSLEGAPQKVRGEFNYSENPLISLDELPQKIGEKELCQEANDEEQKYLPLEQDGKTYNLYNMPDGFVIKGDLDLNKKELTELPDLSKIEVIGDFSCSFNDLTSLKGSPKKVGGNFSCWKNQLTSLEGAPVEVGGYFGCSFNQLTSLEGAPRKVGNIFDCHKNQLTSLKGAPIEVGGNFVCMENPLVSLEGAPQKIGGEMIAPKIESNDFDFTDYDIEPQTAEALKAYPCLARCIKNYLNDDKETKGDMSDLGVWFRTLCTKKDLDPIDELEWNYDEDFDIDEYWQNRDEHPEWNYTTEYAYDFSNSGSNSRWGVLETFLESEEANDIAELFLNIAKKHGDINIF